MGAQGEMGEVGERGAIGAPGIDTSGASRVSVPSQFELPGVTFAWDVAVTSDGRFFSGDLVSGSLLEWSLEQPRPREFASSRGQDELPSALEVSPDGSMVWVCYFDTTPTLSDVLASRLVGYDTATGAEVVSHALSTAEPSLCTDLDFDDAGNLYVAALAGSNISPDPEGLWRVPAADLMTEDSAALWLSVPGEDVITMSFDGSELYVVLFDGSLQRFTVDMAGQPTFDAEVFPVNSFDNGVLILERARDGVHYLSDFNSGGIFRFEPADTAEPLRLVTREAFIDPVGLAFHAGRVWVAESQFQSGFAPFILDGNLDSAVVPTRIASVAAYDGDLPLSPVEMQGVFTRDCASDGGTNVEQTLVFSTAWWKLVETHYEDAACTQASVRVVSEGPYHTGGFAAGGTELDVSFSRTNALALSAEGASTLESEGCGSGTWEVGASQDLQDGCANIVTSINACPTSYTVVDFGVGNALLFGDFGDGNCDEGSRSAATDATPWMLR